MITLSKEQIKEIAEQLDCGFRAFCQRTTGELVFIIDTRRFPTGDLPEEFDEDLAKLEANREDYLEIEAMGSRDSFRVMEDFTQQLTNSSLQAKLYRALDRRGPFREFKYVIDNAGDFRQEWFDYKNQRYIDWVSQQLNAAQEEEE